MSDGWLFRQELLFFRNFMRNWDKDVDDSDFFDIFGNSNNTTVEEAKSMLKKHFSIKELEQLEYVSVERQPPSRVRARHPGRVRPAELIDIDDEECFIPDGDDNGRVVDFSIRRRCVEDAICEIWNKKELRPRCREMLDAWCDLMERHKTRQRSKKDPMEERVGEICRVLKLDETERDLLVYAIVRALTCFDDFPITITKGRNDAALFFAMAVDRPCSDVTKALAASGKLRKFEVLDVDCDLEHRSPFRFFLDGGGSEVLEGRFYNKVATDDALPLEYYGEIAEEHGATLKQMISAPRAVRQRGVNILLYGVPGTGKTSFAKTLARELGYDLFEIRQGDRGGERISSQCRLSGICICNDQVPEGSSMVLVDEADQLLRTSLDFFESMSARGSEKGVINSVLDETKLPTIWVANTPAEALDDSVRRRFDYSIKFKKLGDKQREAIWRNNIARLHLGKLIPSSLLEGLSKQYQTNAGGIAMVLENVKRMRPKKDDVPGLIDRLMKPHCELMGTQNTGTPKKDDILKTSSDYSLEGLNIRGAVALDRIIDAVRRFREEKDGAGDPDRPRMNLLLWGPPGTGKTEFVKHLGSTLGAKVVVKMGSDLLSMWVGGTEHNIKAAFAKAEEDNAILFLDEIDGLVQDRSGAQRSWEVTQVNELLHQMENFKGVMVGATNFMANLDAAIMRRFTFKLQFDYLDEAGKRIFFERMFKTHLTDAEAARLAGIANLAPGDFRTVRQSFHYLGGDVTNAMRLGELEKESSLKKDSRWRIGFQ